MGVIRKYEPGEPFRSMADAIRWLEAGRYFFEGDKPQHPGWVLSWRLAYFRAVVMSGHLRRAVETQAFVQANKRRSVA